MLFNNQYKIKNSQIKRIQLNVYGICLLKKIVKTNSYKKNFICRNIIRHFVNISCSFFLQTCKIIEKTKHQTKTKQVSTYFSQVPKKKLLC